MAKVEDEDRSAARLMRFLRRGPATVEQAVREGCLLLRGVDGALVVESAMLRGVVRTGAIALRGEKVALAAGADSIRVKAGHDDDMFRRQHRETGELRIDAGEGFSEVTVNLAESPLGQLSRYKLRDGTPFLASSEIDAGERLRADYTRGRVMPRLGANWEASVASGRRSGPGGAADLTDAALASRQRVDSALGAVGPELSGVLVDICCFLKGLELVERERGWPVRSAKVVLKTALGALARHYCPRARKAPPTRTLHWGSEDYRPELR